LNSFRVRNPEMATRRVPKVTYPKKECDTGVLRGSREVLGEKQPSGCLLHRDDVCDC